MQKQRKAILQKRILHLFVITEMFMAYSSLISSFRKNLSREVTAEFSSNSLNNEE